MIYWIRVILIGILSFFAFQAMSEEIPSAYQAEICPDNISASNNEKELSFLESSSENYLTRTINHILKSRYADISIPVCVITSNTKDNNDYKSIFPLIGGLQKGSMADRHNGIKQHRHSKSDCLPQSPKDYYIFTLEKIII